MKYVEADCCTPYKELRYKLIKQCKLGGTGECTAIYYDKLTEEVVYEPVLINLCDLVAPLPDPNETFPPGFPYVPGMELPSIEPIDPLTIDPHYTPSKFNQARIDAVEETEDWVKLNCFDRIGNKHGRWFLNGYNFTRYELYELNASSTA